MTERLPGSEPMGVDRRREAIRDMVGTFGFEYLEARVILGDYPADKGRRYRIFREVAESAMEHMTPEAFRMIWREVPIASLAEAGYEPVTESHRAYFRNFETGEPIGPRAAAQDAPTMLERWAEPDGPEIVTIWFRSMRDEGGSG